jgi:hypothetical protein
MHTVSQQIGICALDEILGRVVVAKLCNADCDRSLRGTLRQSIGHVGKASANAFDVSIRQRAHKLIATEPHDQVVGAQTRPQGIGDGDEKRISGAVTLGVVDSLQTVDINTRDHQFFGSTPRTIYLPPKLLEPGSTLPDVGQLVGLRRFTVQRSLGAIVRRQYAVTGGLSTFLGRPDAIIGRTGAIARCPGAIIRRTLPITRCFESLLLPSCW